MKLAGIQDEIRIVLNRWHGPVVIAYSGGKDSSAVLKLVYSSIAKRPDLARKVTVIYCDTKVENPILDRFVKKTLRALKKEARGDRVPITVKILTPALSQRYFVRVIGRGYPPPTNFFRWCTKDLRIRPVQKFVRSLGDQPLIVVGTRWGESKQRDRVLNRAGDKTQDGPAFHRQLDGGRETVLYLPIAKFTLDDVWECLSEIETPKSIDVHSLAQVYRHGGGECPMVRDSNDRPCASARFGCWVCTVVRRDRSAENLLSAGFRNLEPYYDFRSWLVRFRADLDKRCSKRRNGTIGPGPFRLAARKEILHKVRKLESRLKRSLITPAETREIKRLWALDQASADYKALEKFELSV